MNSVLVFPGQGSQRTGMLDDVPEVETLDRLLDAAEGLTKRDLRRLQREGTPAELADTQVAQPLLYLSDWAWGSVLLDVGVRPVAVAGHSLGELAALAVAGVFSVEAGLELVCERARLMAEAVAECPGAMSAVLGLDGQVVADVVHCIDDVWLANDNAPGQVVISGLRDAVAQAGDALLSAGARRVVPLDVAGAFHSPMMQQAADAFSVVLASAEFCDAAIPVLQNTRPDPATEAGEIRGALARQIPSPVRWTETMRACTRYAPVTLIEVGPGSVLRGLAKRVDGIAVVSIEDTGVQAVVEEILQ
ncbi:MAG: ACP S-malonyltransferase [Anaerosomatales bacterium]|nr:ACP S-malonyltransferase [Anaerosomatales bacterium]MDT8433414.1 ACP S-malonyltransferase [Anaerosomatales bacterium]